MGSRIESSGDVDSLTKLSLNETVITVMNMKCRRVQSRSMSVFLKVAGRPGYIMTYQCSFLITPASPMPRVSKSSPSASG